MVQWHGDTAVRTMFDISAQSEKHLRRCMKHTREKRSVDNNSRNEFHMKVQI